MQLVAYVEVLVDVVDCEHVRADAMALEALAVAHEPARVALALAQAPRLIGRAHEVHRVAQVTQMVEVNEPLVPLSSQGLLVHFDVLLGNLLDAAGVVLDQKVEADLLIRHPDGQDVGVLVVDVPQRLDHHSLGDGRHSELQRGGEDQRVHLDELGEALGEDVLSARFEHARDAGLQDLLVPRLLLLLARSAQARLEDADRPDVPSVEDVRVPELVHLLAPGVPQLADLARQEVTHLCRASQVQQAQMVCHLVHVRPRLLAVLTCSAHSTTESVGTEHRRQWEGGSCVSRGYSPSVHLRMMCGQHVPNGASGNDCSYA